jgi:tape measure domain-containing protein
MTDRVIGVRIDGTQAKRGAVQVRRALRSIRDEGQKTTSRLRGLGRALFNLKTAFAALSLGVVSASLIKTATNLTRVERGLKLATGSAKGAAAAMEFIGRNVDRLGLNLQAAEDGFVGLAAAARGTALEGRQTREIFLGVSEAAAAMGLSAEQTQGAFTAIEQIISKGKVSAEELRGQLGERLPGAFQVAARAAGVTTEELDKLLSQGKLLAEDFLPLLARQLRDEFGGAAEEAADSVQGALNGFGTAVERLKRQLATSGALDPIIAGIRAITELLEDPAFLTGATKAAAGLGNAMRFLAENIDLVAIALKSLAFGIVTSAAVKATAAIFAFVRSMGGIATAAAAAGAGLSGFARASATATAAMAGLRTVGLALGGPVGIIAGIGAALVLLISRMRGAKRETEEFRDRLQDLGKTGIELQSDQLKQDIQATQDFLDDARARLEAAEARRDALEQRRTRQRGRNRAATGFSIEANTDEIRQATADIQAAEAALARLERQTRATGSAAGEADPYLDALRAKIQGLSTSGGGQDAADTLKEAEEALDGLRLGLEESIGTFGKSETAALEWRLANGDLAASIKALGDRGPATAAKLVQLSRSFEELKTGADQAEENIATLGRLFDQTRTPAERYAITMAQLDELYINLQRSAKDFGITQAEYDEMFERLRTQAEETRDASERTFDAMTEFATAAARAMQSAMSDFFFSVMQGEFDDLEDNFKRTIDRMVANFLSSQLLNLFAAQAGTGGFIGALGTAVAGGRAQGGVVQQGRSFLVGEDGPEIFTAPENGRIIPHRTVQRLGSDPRQGRRSVEQSGEVYRGIASNMVDAIARDNRLRPGQSRYPGRAQGGPVMRGQPVIAGEVGFESFQSRGGTREPANINVNMTVNAADADSFRQSQGQILSDMSRLLQSARVRNG